MAESVGIHRFFGAPAPPLCRLISEETVNRRSNGVIRQLKRAGHDSPALVLCLFAGTVLNCIEANYERASQYLLYAAANRMMRLEELLAPIDAKGEE